MEQVHFARCCKPDKLHQRVSRFIVFFIFLALLVYRRQSPAANSLKGVLISLRDHYGRPLEVSGVFQNKLPKVAHDSIRTLQIFQQEESKL